MGDFLKGRQVTGRFKIDSHSNSDSVIGLYVIQDAALVAL